jgi:photosystem II stability/assembly factor-like uncharacterized protein
MTLKTTRVATGFFLMISALFFGALVGCRSTPDTPAAEKEVYKNPNGRNDAWGFTGYGGGGAMFFPAVSPFNTNHALVACDMTGSFITANGGETWRMFNLRGPVHYFVYDPLDSNVMYANSIGLFKSVDQGKTWSLWYPGPSEVDGVVSKGDHASEVLVTKDSTRRNVLALAIDPEDSKKLYAAISIDKQTGFYTSVDGGLQWKKEHDIEDHVKNVFVVPKSSPDNRTIYIAGAQGVTVRENGAWKTNPAPQGVSQLTTFTGGYDETKNVFVLYAMAGKSYFDPEGKASGIFYSPDGGATWTNREAGILSYRMKGAELPEYRTIATSALHPEVVYVSYRDLKVHADTTCMGVARSTDFGVTWTLAWKDKLTKEHNYPSANFSEEWINERFGPTWGENPFSIGVSPTHPEVCYGTDFGRTVKTTDGGKTWEQVYTTKKDGGWTSRGLEVTTGYGIMFDPSNRNHAFIANTDVGLMETHNGGASWQSATRNNGVPRAWQNSVYWLTFDPDVKGKAWSVMSGTHDLPRPKMWRRNGVKNYEGGVLVTEDDGKTWQIISKDIGEAAMTHILFDPTSPKEKRTLYACAFGKGVYKSTDGGKTWQQKNKGIEGAEPFAWRITRRDSDGVLFLVVCRRGEDESIGTALDGALYRSDNAAESWTKVSLPAATNGPMSLMATAKSNRLLLAAWGRNRKGAFASDIGGGIFASADDGKTWQAVLPGDQHMHDITYDKRMDTYYACGFNGSAYRSEDEGSTWTRIKGYNFKWGKRVDIDPKDSTQIYVITFGGGVWHGPAKGDEQAVEDIVPALVRK